MNSVIKRQSFSKVLDIVTFGKKLGKTTQPYFKTTRVNGNLVIILTSAALFGTVVDSNENKTNKTKQLTIKSAVCPTRLLTFSFIGRFKACLCNLFTII